MNKFKFLNIFNDTRTNTAESPKCDICGEVINQDPQHPHTCKTEKFSKGIWDIPKTSESKGKKNFEFNQDDDSFEDVGFLIKNSNGVFEYDNDTPVTPGDFMSGLDDFLKEHNNPKTSSDTSTKNSLIAEAKDSYEISIPLSKLNNQSSGSLQERRGYKKGHSDKKRYPLSEGCPQYSQKDVIRKLDALIGDIELEINSHNYNLDIL
ncbi:hypothetical protein BB558_000374 [Smittium angustum]|uniref:Uncharacterized protein n=1 Tax=Smittium angustum TaxID=133377 RepID=A0A2U1JEE7_SMIAN|nr:hypothetical protein BB558_000374 [Smittium angustum]